MTFDEIARAVCEDFHYYGDKWVTESRSRDIAADMVLEGYRDMWDAWDEVISLPLGWVRFTVMGYEYNARTLAVVIDYRNEQIDHPWQLEYFNRWHEFKRGTQ